MEFWLRLRKSAGQHARLWFGNGNRSRGIWGCGREKSKTPRMRHHTGRACLSSRRKTGAKGRSTLTRVTALVDGGKINGGRGDGPRAIRTSKSGARTQLCRAPERRFTGNRQRAETEHNDNLSEESGRVGAVGEGRRVPEDVKPWDQPESN
jgi:hypothetical protein